MNGLSPSLECGLFEFPIPKIPGCSPAPPNYPFRYPQYQLIESLRHLIEVHWQVLFSGMLCPLFDC